MKFGHFGLFLLAAGVIAGITLLAMPSRPGQSGDSSPIRSDARQTETVSPSSAVEKSGPPLGPYFVHYHERTPYMTKTGEGIKGLTADRVSLVLNRSGIDYEWRQTPPKRQLELAKEGAGRDIFLGWFKNPEREEFARFSVPLYQDRPTIAVARTGTLDPDYEYALADVLSSPRLRLLLRDGYSYGKVLDAMIRESARNRVVTTVDNIAMLKMIRFARAEYFFITVEEASVAIEASALPRNDFVFIHFADMPPGNIRYLMYSKKVDAAVIKRIDAEISRAYGEIGGDSHRDSGG